MRSAPLLVRRGAGGLAALGVALAFAVPLANASAVTGDAASLGPTVTVGRLPAGGTYIVRPVGGAPVAAIELWYRAPAIGFGSNPVPSMSRLAAQVVAASKPLVGDSLGKEVVGFGGRLGVTVYNDSVSISAVVPATAAKQVVKTMTTAFFAPVLTEEGYRQAQQDVAQEALLAGFDPETAVRDAIFASLFSSGPQHYPTVGPAKDVAAIPLNDVRAFATRAFRSQNAVLVISGAVDASVGGAAATGRPAGDDSGPEPAATPQIAASFEPVSKVFDQPAGGYGWIGPPIASEREATAMDFIADFLFRGDTGYVARRVAEKFPDAIVQGQFITLHDPGVMFVVYSGKNLDDLKVAVDAGFAFVRKPMDPKVFAAALDAFKYHLLSDLQTPSQMADNFGWYSVEGDPAYAPGANGENGNYFRAADSLSPEFVVAVAEKYLAKRAAAVSLRPDQEKAKSP